MINIWRLDTVKNRLEVKRNQAKFSRHAKIEQAAPLSMHEEPVFDAICRRLKAGSGLSEDKAQAVLDDIIALYGKKALVELFIGETLVLGVPAAWFLLTAPVSMLLFLYFQSFDILLFVAPGLHMCAAFYYQNNRDMIRKAKINKILKESV